MKSIRSTIIFSMLILYCGTASSQHLESLWFQDESEHKNAAQLVLDWDPTLTLGLGYGRVIPIHFGSHNRNIMLNLGLSVPIFLIPAADTGTIKLGGSIFVFDSPWNIKAGLALRVQRFNNNVSEGSAFSGQIDLYPGYFAPNWSIALQLSYRSIFLVHLTHLQSYKDNFEGVQDGWYDSMASYFFFALSGGVLLGDRVSITLRAGVRVAGTFESYSPYLIPWIFSLGTEFWF